MQPSTGRRRLRIMITLAPDHVRSLIPRVQRCEAIGIDAIGFGDSPACQDPYVCLATAASSTSRVELGTMVTNAVTRSHYATARAISSIDDLSGGRAFLGIGTGDSALHAASERPPAVGIDVDRLIDQLGSRVLPALRAN